MANNSSSAIGQMGIKLAPKQPQQHTYLYSVTNVLGTFTADHIRRKI
jgi:hypothetical protein